jgi:hypothetical protein
MPVPPPAICAARRESAAPIVAARLLSYTVPPGHDAWVEGKERFVSIEVMSAEQFAKA